MGLTHICGTTRAGDYLLVRHTSRKRMAAKLRWVRDELTRRRHLSIKKQGLWLQRVVGGYFNYHAMPTNIEALGGLGEERLEVVLDHRIEWRGGRPAQSVDVPGPWPSRVYGSSRNFSKAKRRNLGEESTMTIPTSFEPSRSSNRLARIPVPPE